MIEQAGVSGKVRARRAADRFLVDPHQALDRLHAASDVAAEGRRCASLQFFAFLLIGERPVAECFATSSTSTWLTRVDLPEPETPVTVVNTPSGKRDVELVQVIASDAGEAQPARGARAASGGKCGLPNR